MGNIFHTTRGLDDLPRKDGSPFLPVDGLLKIQPPSLCSLRDVPNEEKGFLFPGAIKMLQMEKA